MRTRSAEAIVRLMAATDPRQTASAVLEFLLHANDARTGAIFVVEDGVRLLVGQSIDQGALDWTSESWTRNQDALSLGRQFRSEDRFLLPVRHEGRLIALVYLATGQVSLDTIGEISPLVAEAVARAARSRPAASAAPSIDSYLASASLEEIERKKLILLLDRHEWNISRVARTLRVTRNTIYKRLAALGIARRKVAKGSRTRSAPPVGPGPRRLA